MNTLEQYIVQIISVEPCEQDWMRKYHDKKFVKVELETNCYGAKTVGTYVWSEDAWERIKELGYFMA